MATKSKSNPPQQPMAYVSIAHHGYLLPIAEAQRLVTIMARVVEAERDLDEDRMTWVFHVPRDPAPIKVSMELVQPSQVRSWPPAPPGGNAPRRIGREPLKLEGPDR